MEIETCATCVFWLSLDDMIGSCHARAPQAVLAPPHHELSVRWPWTQEDEFCGDFRKKKEIDNA